MLAYKIIGACVRSRLETDIDQLMFTNNDDALTEATERMYKAESIHIWDHFNEVTRELRVISYANREHMNNHIKSTGDAIKEIFVWQEEQKKGLVTKDEVYRLIADTIPKEINKRAVNNQDLESDKSPTKQAVTAGVDMS